MADYYTVLGVSKDASADTIKKAFHKLAKQYHPDATGGNESAKKKFVEINQAYETLSDPEKRKAYDAARQNPFKGFANGQGSPFGGSVRYEYTTAGDGLNFDELLNDLFGGRTATATRARQSLDVLAKCEITPWMAALGGRMDVRVSDKTLSVKVPAGSKSGQKLRLRGQGLTGQGKTGDLLIELTIQNPAYLTPEMKTLYERLAALS